jgi:hypothetical protein
MADYSWEEAMNWWKNSGDFAPLIRNAANNLLAACHERMGCEGQGISSSDTNHEVFHMYGSYLNYVAYCEEHGEKINMVTFLMDVVADI